MANVVNDPRFAMARLMRQQAQSGASNGYAGSALPPAASAASVSLGRAATGLAISNPTLRQQIDAIAGGRQAAEPKGAVGALVSNPVSKTVLGALNVLSIPGRGVAAGIREIIDSRDSDPTTKASFSDFIKNTKDPSYGIGKALKIDTGNIWLDRALGFAGDMVTDPLNYVTFGGAKFAGYAGRLDLANNVLKLTKDAALANKVQRYGRAAIKDAEMLEMLGANRHGLYFLGKRIKVGKSSQGWRLPGSGAIGMLGDNALSKLRVSASKGKAGQWLQKMTLSSDNLAARQAMLQGRVGDDAAAALISYFNADPIQRAAAGEALALEQRKALNLLETEKGMGLDGYKAKLPDLIESDELFNAASPELQRAAQVWRDLFGGYEDNITTLLKEIDPSIDPTTRFRANYFPRMLSEDGLEYIADASATHSSSLRSVFARDPLAGGRNFKARTLEVGDDFFGKKLTAEDLKSTSKLNEIAREAGFGGDFFETDISKVLNRYIGEYAKEVGVLARHKHLVETGFWKRAESVNVTGEFIDKELIEAVKKNIKSLDDDMASLARQTAEAVKSLRTNIDEFSKSLKESLDAAQKELDSVETIGNLQKSLDAVLAGDIRLTADQLEMVAGSLGQWKKKFAALFGAEYKNGKLVAKAGADAADTPLAADGMLGFLDTLESDMLRLTDEITAMTLNKTGKELDDAVKMAADAIDAVSRRMSQAEERLKVVMQFGNALEEGLQAMSRGETYFGGSQEVQNILAVLARDGAVTTDTVRKVIDEQFNLAGELQDFLTKWVNSENGIFDAVTIHSGLNNTDVSKFSVSDLYNVLNKAYDTNIDANEMRIAALFSLASDERLYGSAIPEPIQKMRHKLIERLRRVDEAIAYDESQRVALAQGTRRTGRKMWESQVQVDYDRVISYKDELLELEKFAREFGKQVQDIMKTNPEVASLPLPSERLREIIGTKYPKVSALLGDSEENWAELMGANMQVNTRVSNVEHMADVEGAKWFNTRETDTEIQYKKYSTGSGFTEVDKNVPVEIGRMAPSVEEEYTFTEFLDLVNQRISRINSYMDEPVFKYGVGVSEKSYTGKELVARYDKYMQLKDELSEIGRVRREFEEDIRIRLGYYDIDLEEVGVSADELARRKSKVEYIKQRARTEAGAKEFDDVFIYQLKVQGYFKIPRDSADFIAARERAYDRATNAFLDVKSKRPGQRVVTKDGKVVVNKRQSRVTFGDKYSEVRDRIAEIAGTDENIRPQWLQSLETEKRALAADLTDYAMVSEIHSRFNGVAGILNGFGLVPTQRMFGQVIDTVNQKFVPRITSKISALNESYTILKDMDIEVSRRLAANDSGQTPAQIFSDVLNSLTPSQKAKLQEAIGDELNWTADPYDLKVGLYKATKGKSGKSSGSMRNADGTIKVDKNGKAIPMPSEKRVAENEYYESFVRPWFESRFPNKKYSKEAAKTELRRLAPSRSKEIASTVSAFAEGAEPSVIRNWFTSLIGSSEIRGRAGNRIVTSDGPLIGRRIRELREAEKRYRSMLLPDLDIAKFFDDPSIAQKTPTWYAYMLQDHADRLERSINVKRAKNEQIVASRTRVGELEADVVGKQAEYERVRSAPELIDRLQRSRNALVDRRDALQAKTTLTNTEKRELAGLPAKIKTANDELAKASRLPKATQENIAGAERRRQRINQASKPRLELETELDELKTEGRVLYNKSRTTKGLTKKEDSRLKAIQKRVGQINEELKKPLVGEDGKPLRETPRDRDVFNIPKAQRNLEGANKIIDEYNELIGLPTYSKAMDDKAMIDAMVALSRFDLSRFEDGFIVVRADNGVLPDGTYGVLKPAEYATMPDGSRIVFSKDEWDSLYKPDYPLEERQRLIGEVQERIAFIKRDTNNLTSQLRPLEKQLANVPQEFLGRTAPEGYSRQYKQIQDLVFRVNELKKRIKWNNEDLQDAVSAVEALNPQTQQIALMKLKVLVHGSEAKGARVASRPVFNGEGLSKFLSFEHPSQSVFSVRSKDTLLFEGTTSAEELGGKAKVNSIINRQQSISMSEGMARSKAVFPEAEAVKRAERIQHTWSLTDEKALLDRADKLRNNLFVRMDFDMREDIFAGQSVVETARAEVARIIRESQGLGGEVDKARARARDIAETADVLTEQRTGLPAGTRLDEKFVDDAGNSVYREPGERIDPGLTREVDEDGVPFVSAENLRSPDDFREFSEMVIDNNAPSGPFALRADQPQSAENLRLIGERFDKQITAEQERLTELTTSGASKRQIKISENKIQRLRDAKEEALVRARGEEAAVAEYLDVRQKMQPTGQYKENGTPIYAPMEEIRAYNAAKQTAEEWNKENKAALDLARKAWDEKSLAYDNAQVIVREIQRQNEVVTAEINRRFGGADEYFDYVMNQRNLVESLQKQIADIESLSKMPPKTAGDILMAAAKTGKGVKKPSKAKVDEAISQYRVWLRENKPVFDKLASEPNNPVYKAWAAAAQADADLMWLQFSKGYALENLASAELPAWKTIVVEPFAKEWEKAAKASGLYDNMARGGTLGKEGKSTGFPGLMGNKQALDLLDNIARIREPGVVDDLSRFMRGYTGFFRAYATLSPGFHVRNSISNVFSMFAAGADVKNMREGFRYWRLFDSAMKSGKSVDEFIASLPEEVRPFVQISARTVLGLGGGRVDNAMEGFARGGNKLTSNGLLDMSRQAGHNLEGSARFMLAYDSAVKGFNFNESFNRTGRFLIDYNKRTLLDDNMRDIVPFWMWMSRNLPLQIMNRWANPKPYLTWQKVQKNFGQENERGEVTPGYLQGMGAINLGGGKYFNPDLPFTRVNEQVQDLANPRKLMSYVNPGIRAPLEFLMNSNTYTGRPFADKFHKVDGALIPFLPLLEATGQVSHDSRGNPVVSERAYSLLMNMIPPLGRAERLFPAEGSGNAGNALAGFVGLPFTNVTAEMQDKEKLRRMFAMQELAKQQGNIQEAQ
jgi:hypothetical protein